jgi:hypothetical protein
MKCELCNRGNSKAIFHETSYGHTHNGIEDFPTILEHVIVPSFMTLRSKMFRKYEVHDGLYHFLLCVIKVIFFQNLSYFQDHDQY